MNKNLEERRRQEPCIKDFTTQSLHGPLLTHPPQETWPAFTQDRNNERAVCALSEGQSFLEDSFIKVPNKEKDISNKYMAEWAGPLTEGHREGRLRALRPLTHLRHH